MTKIVSIKLEEKEVQVLKQYARRNGLVFSSFIASILKQEVKNIKKEKQN